MGTHHQPPPALQRQVTRIHTHRWITWERREQIWSHWRENLRSPAHEVREQSRSDVPGGVDGVAAVGAHGDPNKKHCCSHQHRLKTIMEGSVPLVPESQDTQQQRSGADHLVTRRLLHVHTHAHARSKCQVQLLRGGGDYLIHDSPPHAEVVSWVGGEYSCCGGGSRHRQLASAVCLDGICNHLIKVNRSVFYF